MGYFSGTTGVGGRVKGETGFKETVEDDAEGPGVGDAAVVGLSEDYFGGGVVC
jgi:hypothetical protein